MGHEVRQIVPVVLQPARIAWRHEHIACVNVDCPWATNYCC